MQRSHQHYLLQIFSCALPSRFAKALRDLCTDGTFKSPRRYKTAAHCVVLSACTVDKGEQCTIPKNHILICHRPSCCMYSTRHNIHASLLPLSLTIECYRTSLHAEPVAVHDKQHADFLYRPASDEALNAPQSLR